MRRALVSMVPLGGGPFTVGDPATTQASGSSVNTVYVNQDNPAPRAGTLASVDVYAALTTTVTVFTGTLSGGTFTVTAAADLSVTTGLNSAVPVSLAINPGGLIGVWSATAQPIKRGTSGGTGGTASSSTKPAPGGTYTLTAAPGAYYPIQGTGS